MPRTHVEAALALGATRWEMMRAVGAAVRPVRRHQRLDARPGPRARRDRRRRPGALDELRRSRATSCSPGGNTFAANIALQYGFAGKIGVDALIASGLVLFVITLVVNMAARYIIARRREFSEAN